MRVLDVDDDTEFLEQQVSEDMRSSKQMIYDFAGGRESSAKNSALWNFQKVLEDRILVSVEIRCNMSTPTAKVRS